MGLSVGARNRERSEYPCGAPENQKTTERKYISAVSPAPSGDGIRDARSPQPKGFSLRKCATSMGFVTGGTRPWR